MSEFKYEILLDIKSRVDQLVVDNGTSKKILNDMSSFLETRLSQINNLNNVNQKDFAIQRCSDILLRYAKFQYPNSDIELNRLMEDIIDQLDENNFSVMSMLKGA